MLSPLSFASLRGIIFPPCQPLLHHLLTIQRQSSLKRKGGEEEETVDDNSGGSDNCNVCLEWLLGGKITPLLQGS